MITVVYLDCVYEDSSNNQTYNQDSKDQKRALLAVCDHTLLSAVTLK